MGKKEIQEYMDKYGDVPNGFTERFSYFLKELNFSSKEINSIRKGVRRLISPQWEEFKFVIYFYPKATPRARFSGRTAVFYVKDAKFNSDVFKEFMETHKTDFGIITTPTIFNVELFLPIPSGMNRKEKIFSELKLIKALSKPDWDNAGKTYSDMIQNHLLLDDSLIFDGRTRKFYSCKPRIEVSIRFMKEYDCKYNKRKIESWGQYRELQEKILEKDSIV